MISNQYTFYNNYFVSKLCYNIVGTTQIYVSTEICIRYYRVHTTLSYTADFATSLHYT